MGRDAKYISRIKELANEGKTNQEILEDLQDRGLNKNLSGRILNKKDISDTRSRLGLTINKRGPYGCRKKKENEVITLNIPSQKAFVIYADTETIKQIIGT